MKVIQGIGNLPVLSKNTVIALGNFDGVHIGHQKILQFLVEKAKEKQMISLVLTFSPHPGKVLGRNTLQMIQTLEQRLFEIGKHGIQMAMILPFDKLLADRSSHDFLKSIFEEIVNPLPFVRPLPLVRPFPFVNPLPLTRPLPLVSPSLPKNILL